MARRGAAGRRARWRRPRSRRAARDRALALGPQAHAAARDADRGHARAVPVVHAGRHRLAHEVVVHVRAQPVRVGHVVVGAGRDEQARAVGGVVGEGLPGLVAVEREAALQAAAQLRQVLEPAAVGGQVMQVGLAVAAARRSRQRLASGVDDSPIAKRGCRPRSISIDRRAPGGRAGGPAARPRSRTRRRRPVCGRSRSGSCPCRRSQQDRGPDAARWGSCAPGARGATCGRGAPARRAASHRSASTTPRPRRQRAFQRGLSRAGRRRELAGRGEALELAVAAAHRDERDDAGALIERPGRRAHGPGHALSAGTNGAPTSTNARTAMPPARRASAARAKSSGGSPLAEARQRRGGSSPGPSRPRAARRAARANSSTRRRPGADGTPR